MSEKSGGKLILIVYRMGVKKWSPFDMYDTNVRTDKNRRQPEDTRQEQRVKILDLEFLDCPPDRLEVIWFDCNGEAVKTTMKIKMKRRVKMKKN